MKVHSYFFLVIQLLFLLPARSQNPIIQTIYTADPAVLVHKDTLFLYTGHDEDNSTWFTMKDWHVYATTDMVNWTDKGSPLSVDTFSWAKKDAWAGQCIERNGKFYWYVCLNDKKLNRMSIGVAVSDRPDGPFKDALGKPLIANAWGDIDPTVFIDDDGQAYLYWGNPNLYYVKLNEDMVSFNKDTGVVKVPLTGESFKYRVRNAENTFKWAASVNPLNAHAIKNKYDDKYYWFVTAKDKTSGKNTIALGQSDKAIGPYKDILGKPFISNHFDTAGANPTVIFDDAGQACLVWGKNELWYVNLEKDFMSYNTQEGIRQVPTDKQEWFSAKIKSTENSTEKRQTTYEEGPWLYKRNSLYYLLYPAGGVPEHLAYSTAKSPTGPWVYRDTIMPIIKDGGAFTNHPAMADYKGHTFFFYHNGALPGGGGFNRSVCVDEITFNPDGSLPRLAPTPGLKTGVGTLNPFIRQEAETIAWEKGIETKANTQTGVYVTDINSGDYIKVRDVNFSKSARKFEAGVLGISGGTIEIHLDGIDGELIGTCTVKQKKGNLWETVSCKVNKTKGIHDVYFVFKGADGDLFDFDWWKFL
ncbi:family 43 glycosylhydrolase [Flavobacterium rhizosphaerae]|uniref:Family 43 glycosylhydrolase n=1 Tax=Flavobacterium rhizosphaerae TaxID=3163298 RepID=A0ABW8YTR0_9FLAO